MEIKRDVFSRLKRLFANDVIIRNVGGDQLKVVNIDGIQSMKGIETNALIDRFSRLYTTAGSSLWGQQLNINFQTLRPQLYSEYDLMDTDAIVASVLDIIADESSLRNDMGEIIQIKSSNGDIQKILYNLFYDVLNIEFNLWSWVRQMCKYGDFFLKLEIAEKFGVYNVIPYNAFHIERQEGFDPDNPHSIRFLYNPDGFTVGNSHLGISNSPIPGNTISFDNYEVAHFRLLSDINYLPYGRSYLEPARKLFKQYTLMEDSMLIHRIVRSADKRIFYINVGNIPSNDVETFMQRTIDKIKKVPHMDPQTGEYNLRYNLQNMLEDIYIPIRGNDTSTKIDTAPGLTYDGIQDVEYLRDKLFAALKVPRAFMGYAENIEGKSTLAAMDIRFARTIDRLQRIVLSELHKIALIHLYTQGFTDENLLNFELSLTTPSIIYDQERIMLLKEKVELSNFIIENKLFPRSWIYDKIWHLSEDEYEEYKDLIIFDTKRDFRIEQIKNEGNDPLETGESYGTPHDLASLYGAGRYQSTSVGVPDGYDEKIPLGRPKTKISNINTQLDPLGKDRLGVRGNKKDDNESDDIRPKYKGGSPLALENLNTEYIKNERMLKQIPKKKKKTIIYEGKNKSDLLNENNLREE